MAASITRAVAIDTLRPAAYKGGAGSSQSSNSFKTGAGVGGTYNTNYPQGALEYFTVPTYTPVTGPIPQVFGSSAESRCGA